MLAYVGSNKIIHALQQRVQRFNKERCFAGPAVLVYTGPFQQLLPPVLDVMSLAALIEQLQDSAHIAGNIDAAFNIFV